MREFERVEALEGLDDRMLLQELCYYFGDSAGGIVEAHLKYKDSKTALGEVKIILDDLFGQKIDSTAAMMDGILSRGQIGRDDFHAHIALYREVIDLEIAAKTSKALEKIDTRENIHKIVKHRLAYGSEDFHRKEVKLIREHGRHSSMRDLKEKISDRLKIIDNKKAGETTPMVGDAEKVAATSSSDNQQQQQQPRVQLPPPPQQKTSKTYAGTTKSPPVQQAPASPSASGRKRCLVCSAGHAPFECNYMRGLSVDARLDALRSKNLCFKCFAPGHRQFECTEKPICGICHRMGHQTLLHNRTFPPRADQRHQAAEIAATTPAATTIAATTMPASEDAVPPQLGEVPTDA